ncbi:MAG: acyltransferase family protein [Fibrobacter sp.]|nr:acyltransferase family protein [Fibrobacter sp.]
MKSGRLLWPDILKILSIYGVVLIHSAAPMLTRYDSVGMQNWWVANIYDSLVRWCIPVFFMASGAFLIAKAGKESPGQFFMRRSRKIIVPFLIWSAVYFLWRIYLNGEDLQWTSFFSMLFREPIYYHLWFIYILIELYLLAPVLGVYVKSAGMKNQLYLLSLWFIFCSILPMLEIICGFQTILSIGSTVSFINYAGYFFLGYFLHDIKLKPVYLPFLFLLFALGFLATAYGTFYLSIIKGNGTFSGVFYEYYTVNVLAMSVSVFLIIKSIPVFQVSSRGILTGIIAACVPGIYFVHAIVIAVFKRNLLGFTLSESSLRPSIGIPVFALAVFGISLVITQIIKIIPGIRCAIP